MLTRYCICLAAMLVAVTPTAAPAANIVTLTFESVFGFLQTQNLVESGFRISPNCHVDIFPGDFLNPALPSHNVLGFDSTSCSPDGGLFNPNYLGGTPNFTNSFVYIDNFDHPFKFLSFEHFGQPATVTSSKGGVYTIPLCIPDISCGQMSLHHLAGPDWNGVKWILLFYDSPGAPASLFDNLRFHAAASAPGTLALFATALLALGFRRPRATLLEGAG
jgi:hypothetical protein